MQGLHKDEPQLFDAVKRTVRESTIKLVHRGVRDASRGNNYVWVLRSTGAGRATGKELLA